MDKNKEKEEQLSTRKLTDVEIARVKLDLAIRGWSSLVSAAMVVFFAIILTVRGSPIFAARHTSFVCIGAIWIAVVIINFGMVRHGLSFLRWRSARHIGVLSPKEGGNPELLENIFNIVGAVIFTAVGVAVLIAGKLGLESIQTITQIPLSLLAISFGVNSAEAAVMHFWLRKVKLADVIHEVEKKE